MAILVTLGSCHMVLLKWIVNVYVLLGTYRFSRCII